MAENDIDTLESGAVSWQDRLANTIELISPSGKAFSAKWRGNPRTREKRLGIFEYPKVAGNVVQDLGSNSLRQTLNIYFDGRDHDLESDRFFEATKEIGLWDITHPVHGFYGLQLVSVRENDEPITSGNVTEFVTEWIEPIDEVSLETARELAGIVDGLGNDTNSSSSEQFEDGVMDFT
ncbi:MAG: DNA circularization N-terminal domain-containing protein [Candidatus Thorarchaeota archaeon]